MSVVLCGDIGLHPTKSKIATVLGPLRDRDGVLLQQFDASVLGDAPGASS